MQRRDVLVATWAGGGNLPPLLSVAQLLAGRGCAVRVLTSRATQKAAEAGGLHVVPYTRSPQPDMTVAFESQAAEFMAVMAGPEIASEVRENLNQLEPQLLVADCMLPAALAAGRATGTPTASVVHFLYGAARAQIANGSGWTTDFRQLNLTRTALGLQALAHPIEAWEEPDLVLVTAPRWFDLPADFAPHVLHAGPVGIRRQRASPMGQPLTGRSRRPRVLITFSTTVITHAGLGTTLRAIAHGVPQLMLPLGRDQHLNATRVTDLGAGIMLAAKSPPAKIAAALLRILDDSRC